MYLAGVSTDNVRDWRRRDLINGIGVSNPDSLTGRGHWRYSLGDLVSLAVVGWFARRGNDLTDAAAISVWLRPPLVAFARSPENRSRADNDLVKRRWWAFFRFPGRPPMGFHTVVEGSERKAPLYVFAYESLLDLESKRYAAEYTLIDAEALAGELPEKLRAEINEAASK
jgi:hypothetical protein